MNYFDDMRCKSGFNDGMSVPEEAWMCRTVYVQAINALAAKHESAIRALAYDRPGVHNSCMIVFILRELFDRLEAGTATMDDEDRKKGIPFVAPDNAMDKAIEEAFNMELDDYVHVEVSLSPEWDKQLRAIA